MAEIPAGTEPVWRRAVAEHIELLRFWRSPLGLKLGGLLLASGRDTRRFQQALGKRPRAVSDDAEAIDEAEVPQTEDEFNEAAAHFRADLVAFHDRLIGPF